jgi:hypothetical protein
MEELLMVGTFWFWAVVIAEVLLLFCFTQSENGLAATCSFLAFLAILQFWSKVDLFSYIKNHPLHIVAGVLAYIGLGIAWVIFKWRKLVLDQARQYDELFATFLVRKNLPPVTKVLPEIYRADWRDTLRSNKIGTSYRTLAEVPLVRENKAKIIRWMSLWVFSVILYLFMDMVKEIFTSIYQKLASFLQRSADNIYSSRNINENLEIPKKD